MNPPKKIISQQKAEEQQQATGTQQTQQQSEREFASAEEMLRHDALHTMVPPSIAHRLQQSLDKLPAPAPRRSWWRRIFPSS